MQESSNNLGLKNTESSPSAPGSIAGQARQVQSINGRKHAGICPVCHQLILPSYYFCPNCGTKLDSAPLSVTPTAQARIYALSIIMPATIFIFLKWWPATRYIKSGDPKAKRIGQIAWGLLILSTILTIWLSYVWTQNAINSAMSGLNSSMLGY